MRSLLIATASFGLLLATLPVVAADSVMHCESPLSPVTEEGCLKDWTYRLGILNTVCAIGNAFVDEIPEECIH